MKNERLHHLVLLLNRLTLGALFFLAGIKKLIPTADQSFVDMLTGFAEQVAGMAPLPEPLGLAYGYALPFVEIVAGLLLALGLFTRVAAVVIALMLLSFMIEFGVAWWPDSGPVFDKNVIYFTLALLLAVVGGGGWALDRQVKIKRRG